MKIRSRAPHGKVTAAGVVLACGVLSAQEIGWFSYGRDTEGTRYFPAAEITRKMLFNVRTVTHNF